MVAGGVPSSPVFLIRQIMISDVTLVDVRTRQVFDEVAFQATLRCHSVEDRRAIVSRVEHAGKASGYKFSGWEQKNLCMYNRESQSLSIVPCIVIEVDAPSGSNITDIAAHFIKIIS